MPSEKPEDSKMPVFVVIYLKDWEIVAICETYISRTFPKKAEPYNIANQPHNAVHATEYEYAVKLKLDLDSIIFECHVRCCPSYNITRDTQ